LGGATLICATAFAFPAAAGADLGDPVNQWLPSSEDASWTYEWTNTDYGAPANTETYTVSDSNANSFTLEWNAPDDDNSATSELLGQASFSRTQSGLTNLGWTAVPPAPDFPILCSEPTPCANSLGGALFMVLWGSRGPVLSEPLYRGSSWTSVGGGDNDVVAENRYRGAEVVNDVDAFPSGVTAAKVESTITQAGAIGDPFGSGERTVWWVYGVGPVKVRIDHTGGEVSQAELTETNLAPLPAPSDFNYLPFELGETAVYRWRNTEHMRKASKQRFTVAQVSSNTARVDVEHIKGPIEVAGSYVFTTRLNGITNISTATSSRTLAKFPNLGPSKKKRNRLLTPFDFMTFGLSTVLPAFPEPRMTWVRGEDSRDYKVYGVDGRSQVLGIRRVKTRDGRVNALVVRSVLKQKRSKFGDGVRLSFFQRGKGLVKLWFRHGDGSVSIIDRVR
jgi:hypothetical protein